MTKDVVRIDLNAPGYVVIDCPGCGFEHYIPVAIKEELNYQFYGSFEHPTIVPTVTIKQDKSVCSFFVVKGIIMFKDDSTHKLRGKIAHLQPLEPDTIITKLQEHTNDN